MICVLALASLYLSHHKAFVASLARTSAPAKAEWPKRSVLAAQNNPAPAPTNTVSPTNSTVEEAEGTIAAFDDFARWTKQSINLSASVVEGERLAWKRREAMLELIQTDPGKALALTVPFAWRQTFPMKITRFFEEQVDGRGDFNVAVPTDFEHGQSAVLRSVQIGTSRYQAFVYGRRLAQGCQKAIPLHGIALEGKLALHADPLRVLAPEEAASLAKQLKRPLDPICGVSGQPVTSRNQSVFAEGGGGLLCFCSTDYYDLVSRQWALAESGAGAFGGSGDAGVGGSISDSWTHGPKSLLYMRVNFPDELTEPISETDAYSAMNAVDAYYVQNSYNLTSLDPTVAPLVTRGRMRQ
jgi:hypothetical protein